MEEGREEESWERGAREQAITKHTTRSLKIAWQTL